MEPVIRIIYTQEKVAKNGNKYGLVHALIIIDGVEFIRKFALFPSSGARALQPNGSETIEEIVVKGEE